MSDSLREMHGTVKWFDPKKGFGFIIGPAGQDIFVHYTQIEGTGFRILEDGEQVIYDAELTSGRGWHATAVKRDPAAKPPVSVHVKRAAPADPSTASEPANGQ